MSIAMLSGSEASGSLATQTDQILRAPSQNGALIDG
jgi:hypothetical protein